MFRTFVEAYIAKITIPRVMYFASLAPFLIRSKEIVDEIAFSKVSTLEATKRVQRPISKTE